MLLGVAFLILLVHQGGAVGYLPGNGTVPDVPCTDSNVVCVRQERAKCTLRTGFISPPDATKPVLKCAAPMVCMRGNAY